MNGFVEKSSLDYARLHVKLLDGEWKAVEGATATEKAAMRFFKVVVEVP